MSYLEAILLGIVQGLTEFLPVSSSGHLVILQHWFKHNPDDPAMILFDLALHLGTVVAILFYYRHSIKKYFQHLFTSLADLNHPGKLYHQSASIRFTLLAGIAIVVTGLFYALFKDIVEKGFEKAWIVAVCWLITAAVLLLTDQRKHARRSLRQFGIIAAVLVGLAQGAALFPGISRSGSTICVAVLLGLHRRWAGEFSFLIGVPAILGAALLKGKEFFELDHSALDWGPLLAGSVISAVVGLAALSLLIWALRRAKLKYFAAYCAVIAVVTLIVLAVH
ncbi:MAG: undecaprenyl-diphosphate phosphatase [Sedimentisphaerales bacterium]|nr:undecaprenyl-diphosphate phosphatase [Sedimentisphaerales bacterium]